MSDIFRVAVFSAFAFVSATPVAQPSSYSGQEQRDIKALSAEEIQSYLAGSGAGLAKAAELNHYPGPAHVLELADELRLNPEQKQRTQVILDVMQKQAVRHGKVLLQRERELDRQFVAGKITADALHSALQKIGESYADVRGAHLKAHIEQRAILTHEQIAAYDKLRGYAPGALVAEPDARSHAH